MIVMRSNPIDCPASVLRKTGQTDFREHNDIHVLENTLVN